MLILISVFNLIIYLFVFKRWLGIGLLIIGVIKLLKFFEIIVFVWVIVILKFFYLISSYGNKVVKEN